MPVEKRSSHDLRESTRPYPSLPEGPHSFKKYLTNNRLVNLPGYRRNHRKKTSTIRVPAGKSRLSLMIAYLQESQKAEKNKTTSFDEHFRNLTKLTSMV